MPEKSVMEQYIESKAQKNEIIDYDVINGNFKRCKFCNGLFHPRGISKHKLYCKMNPNKKTTYGTKRKWTCRFCNLLFKHNKERNLHQTRCFNNPNLIIIISRIGNKDRLELLKREFPDIHNILNSKQIKQFLNDVKS